jgi:hypothetical protein
MIQRANIEYGRKRHREGDDDTLIGCVPGRPYTKARVRACPAAKSRAKTRAAEPLRHRPAPHLGTHPPQDTRRWPVAFSENKILHNSNILVLAAYAK